MLVMSTRDFPPAADQATPTLVRYLGSHQPQGTDVHKVEGGGSMPALRAFAASVRLSFGVFAATTR